MSSHTGDFPQFQENIQYGIFDLYFFFAHHNILSIMVDTSCYYNTGLLLKICQHFLYLYIHMYVYAYVYLTIECCL